MVKVRVQAGDVSKAKADVVVVNLFQDAKKPAGAAAAVDRASRGAITDFLKQGDFKGKRKETAVLYPKRLGAPRLVLVGLGERGKFDAHVAREASAKAAKRARELGAKRVATIAHGAGEGGLDPRLAAEATVEGALLGLYEWKTYKGAGHKDDGKAIREILLVENDADALAAVKAGARAGEILAECANYARDLTSLAGDDAWAEKFGENAKAMAAETGLKVEVFDRKKIAALGLGGLLGVNQGSVREPRFVVLEHKPPGAKGQPIVLVGKGVTFDTGGISIKPADKMEDMKYDKAGASAVFAALRAAALLDLPVHVVGITAWTDNMPSGSALKPGDVIKALNGKTIEIINTDAEGRLILADALSYASRYKPAAVVELSTLTGGMVIALGNQAAGAFSNNAALVERLKEAADATGERVWEMPAYDEYGEMVKSKIADVKNSAGRSASAATAARFLMNFVDYPFVHLDIAGVAWNEGSPMLNEELNPGPTTGYGVRLLVQLLRRWEGLPAPEKAPKPLPSERRRRR